MNHQPVDRAPRDLWLAHPIESGSTDALAELNVRFPSDIAQIDLRAPLAGKRHKAGGRSEPHTLDAWGCVAAVEGRGPAAAAAPLADNARVAAYCPPAELLAPARFAAVNRGCAGTTRFTLAWSDVQPFGRMQALRGGENALADLSSGNKESRQLLAKLHDHFRREMELWGETEIDAVAIHDDFAAVPSLRVSSRLWRQVLKPLYRNYCEILRGKDKFVFFCSDGSVSDFFGELADIGFDAIYVQAATADLSQLAADYRGRAAFWIDLGGPGIAPPRTYDQVRQEVRRVRKLLDFGSGIIARCRWEPGTPMRNVAAFFEEWMLALPAGA